MIRNYLKVAVRNLMRNKTYAFINLFGLGFSIAAIILIMLYIRFEFNFDNFHNEGEELYRISVKSYHEGELRDDSPIFTPPIGPAMERDFPEVQNYTRYSTQRTTYFYRDTEPLRIDGIIYADSTFFDLFSFNLIHGDERTALINPYSIILTDETAEKLFGKTDVVGNTINIDLENNYLITGVVETPPSNSTIQFNALLSFQTLYNNPSNYMDWNGGNQYYTYVKLANPSQAKNVEAKFPDFMWKYINSDLAKYNVKYELHLQPIETIHLSEIGYTNIYIFAGIGILILLIASFNFINLTTAHYTRRSKEVGIRKVVGADRRTLISQFLSETLLLTFISLLIGIALALLFSPFYRDLMQKDFNSLNLFDPFQLSMFVLLLIVIGIAAGSYPAFYLSSFQAATTFRKDSAKKIGGLSLQNILIVTQFSISIALIILTFTVSDQLSFIKNKELGYNKEQVIVLSLENEDAQQQTELIKQKLLSVPGVISAAASSQVPSNGFAANGYIPEGESTPVIINVVDVDDDFLETMNIDLVRGRNFSNKFTTDQTAYIVNETLAKTFGWEDPIGKTITRNGDHKIIGVVKDFHFASLHEKVKPLIITHKPWKDRFGYVSLKVNSANYSGLIKQIKDEWKSINSGWPFEYSFLDEKFEEVYTSERNFMQLFLYFSALAIVIAALGLFSLSSLSAEQRTKEIGIRKVLGASVSSLTTLLSKKYVLLVLLANIIAWPTAYFFAQKWLEDFAYRIELNPVSFLLAAIIAFAIALLSVSYRILKAASVNPVKSLKYE